MDETKELIETIIKGIQDKKGKNIVIVDLSKFNDTICNYFIICEGDSSLQINAIVNSIKDTTIKDKKIRPWAIDGEQNAEWVAMDYSDILVHVFIPERRMFYDLEHLWADAKLTNIPDID
jgi:ribosome-associated protein